MSLATIYSPLTGLRQDTDIKSSFRSDSTLEGSLMTELASANTKSLRTRGKREVNKKAATYSGEVS